MSGKVDHESKEVVQGVVLDFGLQEFSFMNSNRISCNLFKDAVQELRSLKFNFSSGEKTT